MSSFRQRERSKPRSCDRGVGCGALQDEYQILEIVEINSFWARYQRQLVWNEGQELEIIQDMKGSRKMQRDLHMTLRRDKRTWDNEESKNERGLQRSEL